MKKKRLDQFLIDEKYFETKTKAQANIMAGNVLVNDIVITKSGYQIKEDSKIRIKEKIPFVSRGGIKLAGILDEWNIDVKEKIILDLGASTGGFTDCLLQRGASLIYAVDVGTNQLAHSLKTNHKCISIENTHANKLDTIIFDPKPQWAVIDVSFISLKKIIHKVLEIITDKRIIALYKPQFEVGEKIPNFKGIVKDDKYSLDGIKDFDSFLRQDDFFIKRYYPCVIKGPKGNQEYFIEIMRS